MDRLSKQLVHPASGRAYNLNFNPPKVEVLLKFVWKGINTFNLQGQRRYHRRASVPATRRSNGNREAKDRDLRQDWDKSRRLLQVGGNSNLNIEIFLKRSTKNSVVIFKNYHFSEKDSNILENNIIFKFGKSDLQETRHPDFDIRRPSARGRRRRRRPHSAGHEKASIRLNSN